jgi:hypothetical protein
MMLDFLDLYPKLWDENDQYIKGKDLVNNLTIINDIT